MRKKSLQEGISLRKVAPKSSLFLLQDSSSSFSSFSTVIMYLMKTCSSSCSDGLPFSSFQPMLITFVSWIRLIRTCFGQLWNENIWRSFKVMTLVYKYQNGIPNKWYQPHLNSNLFLSLCCCFVGAVAKAKPKWQVLLSLSHFWIRIRKLKWKLTFFCVVFLNLHSTTRLCSHAFIDKTKSNPVRSQTADGSWRHLLLELAN